jgi:spermidine/putrescine transport system substrate-binding protein
MLKDRFPFSFLAITCLMSSLTISTSTAADEIKIYTWAEYISNDVIAKFEAQTGHKVTQVYFENEQLRDEVITSGRGEAYDLIIVDSLSLKMLSDKALMNDYSQQTISNVKFIDSKAIDACGNTGIPYAWGTMGIAYRQSFFPTPPTSWMDILRPSTNLDKKITIPLDDIDTVAIALIALGYSPFSDNKEELMAAFKLLQETKNSIKTFRNSISYALEKGHESDLAAAVIYSGETFDLKDATGFNDWQYIIPKEGTLLWYECFTSLAVTPPKPATIEFLNFINQPKIAALNAEDEWFATTNQAALKYVSPDYLSDPELFPKVTALQRSSTYQEVLLNGLQMRSRIISVIAQ